MSKMGITVPRSLRLCTCDLYLPIRCKLQHMVRDTVLQHDILSLYIIYLHCLDINLLMFTSYVTSTYLKSLIGRFRSHVRRPNVQCNIRDVLA